MGRVRVCRVTVRADGHSRPRSRQERVARRCRGPGAGPPARAAGCMPPASLEERQVCPTAKPCGHGPARTLACGLQRSTQPGTRAHDAAWGARVRGLLPRGGAGARQKMVCAQTKSANVAARPATPRFASISAQVGARRCQSFAMRCRRCLPRSAARRARQPRARSGCAWRRLRPGARCGSLGGCGPSARWQALGSADVTAWRLQQPNSRE